MSRQRTTRVKSLNAALKEFLVAPSREDSMSNGQLVVAHLGSKGIHLPDPPSFDAVSLKYEKKISTFAEAFNACWNGRRDWRHFDITTLQECDHLQALELPPHVEAAIIAQEEADERAAIAGEEYADLEHLEPLPTEHPPLELLRRPGPKRRKRLRGKLSKRARGKSKLAKAYRAAKAEYHRAGRALRCSHEKC